MTDWIETIKLHAATQAGALGQPSHAIVTSVDAVSHAVKVSIQPEGLESGWIPDCAVAAGGLRISCPAEIGTQVLVVPVEGDAEHPVVVARIFDVSTKAPVSPATGTAVQAGEFGIFLEGGSYLHLTKDNIFLKGSIIVDGSLTVKGDAVAAGISLVHHVHTDVQSGQGISGAPENLDG
jgi:phage baseplate assembly protein gpV